jgi:hypothetical protein
MTLKANLVRAVIMVGTTLLAVFVTVHSTFSTALALCILAIGVSFFIGTAVGLEIDGRAAKRRRHGKVKHWVK